MYRYNCLNPIADVGLALFSADYEKTEELKDADAVLVRSASMHETAFSERLAAIARAGAGVNNIPLEACTKQGIVVFNTPGANANGVKELVFAGMLYASRGVIDGIGWCGEQKRSQYRKDGGDTEEKFCRNRTCGEKARRHRSWRDRRARGERGDAYGHGGIRL